MKLPSAFERLKRFKIPRVLLPVVIVVLSIFVTVLLTIIKTPLQTQRTVVPQIPVSVMEVQPQTFTINLHSHGNVNPYHKTPMGAEIAGRVVEVTMQFQVGSFFEQGDVLMRIDSRDYEAEVKQAQSSVSSARSKLAREEGLANAALHDWRELRPDRPLSEANPLTLRKPQLEEAKAEMESALAKLQKAEFNLTRTVIRAPYNGLVRERNVDVGQYVSRGDILGLIYGTDYAEVRLPLPEQQLDYIDLPDGTSHTYPLVSLRASIAGTAHYWYAQIVRTENVLDERSRSLFAVAMVADPYGINENSDVDHGYTPLRYGTFVEAIINGRTMDNLVVLPRDLLLHDNTIWVVEDLHLQTRAVKVLRTEGDQMYVYSGLENGELVNMSPLGSVFPGTAVEISKRLQADALNAQGVQEANHENSVADLKLHTSQNTPQINNESRMERLPQ